MMNESSKTHSNLLSLILILKLEVTVHYYNNYIYHSSGFFFFLSARSLRYEPYLHLLRTNRAEHKQREKFEKVLIISSL